MTDIRPAIPSDDGAPFVFSSGPIAFRYVFSTDYEDQALDFLKFAFKKKSGEFSHLNHVSVIDEQGNLVGAGAGWITADAIKFQVPMAVQILKFYGLVNGLGVIVRGIKIEGLIKPPKKGVYYVGHFGISETQRGKGLGTKMIEHLEAKAREKGLNKLGLDVADSNPNAQRLYEKLGFEVVEKRVSKLSGKYGKIVDHYYMEKKM